MVSTKNKAWKFTLKALKKLNSHPKFSWSWLVVFSALLSLLLFFVLPSAISFPSSSREIALAEETYPGYVEQSLPLPDDCYHPVGLAWDGEYLWLGDQYGMIYKIRPSDGLVIHSLSSLGLNITGLTWEETTQSLLCVEAETGNIYRLDPENGSVESVFTVPGYSNLRGIAFHQGKDSDAVFYLDKAQKKIVKVAADSFEEKGSFSVAILDLKYLAWDGRYLWSINQVEGEESLLLLISPAKGLVVSAIPCPGEDGWGLAYDRAQAALWFLDRTERRIFKILTRQTDRPYAKDTPFGARIQYVDELTNKGLVNIDVIKTFFAVPQTSIQQTIIAPIAYDNLHQYNDNLFDLYGQQVAYTKESLAVNQVSTPGYETEILNFNVRYFLYPEDLTDETFPPEIRDLYINQKFPPDNDKYQIDHPLVQSASREAITGAPNLYWKYRQINDYVVKHLTYKNDNRWDPAPVVLENGHGSCSEYTMLFIALCRAAGLPARYQGGSRPRDDLPYTDEIFHRWAEVYFPAIGWVPVDPTWNDTRVEDPQIIAPYFGLIISKLLVTTTGGGYSTGPDPEGSPATVRYLKWNYNCYNYWEPAEAEVEINRKCYWNPPSAKKIAYIKIKPRNPVIRLSRGGTNLAVTAFYNDESTQEVTSKIRWKSSQPEVGEVDSQGYFAAWEAGTTLITATHKATGLKDTILVTVVDDQTSQLILTITATTGGTTKPAPGSYTYAQGKKVKIEAIPDDHYRFASWSGDIPSDQEESNPLFLTMDTHKSITANFIRQYTLTISSGNGGTTDPAPGTYTYDDGTEVTIKAIPDSQYEFSGWSGDVESTQKKINPLTFAVEADKSIKANFQLKEEKKEKSGCFLTTLFQDSEMAKTLISFRNFRDKYLLPHPLGQKIVAIYYKYSPFLAHLIKKHPSLKAVLLATLAPMAFSLYLMG
ncbi:hypothetical protein NLC35_02015 [Candidatus Aminicenantes bacterium AC-334-K16]|nr:hypothetical protein [Candidatus Aminicenantes bacterium AC-334-K16]